MIVLLGWLEIACFTVPEENLEVIYEVCFYPDLNADFRDTCPQFFCFGLACNPIYQAPIRQKMLATYEPGAKQKITRKFRKVYVLYILHSVAQGLELHAL